MIDESTRKHGELQMSLLRQELLGLKTCQLTFLTFAFASTGVLLGIVPKLLDASACGVVFLAPLVVVLPCACFFFDKARTITRIVGYYRVLEDMLTPGDLPAWETSLSRSRSMLATGGELSFLQIMLMRRPHGYWTLAYHTFLLLDVLCLVAAWRQAPEQWGVLVAALFLVIACAARNLYLLWQLTVGGSSYDANYENWRELLQEFSFQRDSKDTIMNDSNQSKMPGNKVLNLAKAVDYVRESIVSRVLAENAAGTVTLFAFDAGEGLSEHAAPFDALVQVVEGAGKFTVGGKAHRVGAGQVLLMPANVPHAVKAAKRFKMLLTMLRAKK
jgi:quercetin dioxygenase-like cupin family protein